MQTRVVRKFIWWPRCLHRKCKWLSFANIEQYFGDDLYDMDVENKWFDDRFV